MLVVHFNVLSWQKEKDGVPVLVSQSFGGFLLSGLFCFVSCFFFVIVLVCRIQKLYLAKQTILQVLKWRIKIVAEIDLVSIWVLPVDTSSVFLLPQQRGGSMLGCSCRGHQNALAQLGSERLQSVSRGFWMITSESGVLCKRNCSLLIVIAQNYIFLLPLFA